MASRVASSCACSSQSSRTRPVEVEDLRFLRARTDRTIKITLPGPFTMSQQAYNEAYDDEAELALDFAAAVNEEIRDLFAAGADIVQIDEPWLQSRAEKARAFALPAIGASTLGSSPGWAASIARMSAAQLASSSRNG